MECYIAENGVQECRQNYSSWLQQTIRLYNNREFIDVQTTISPMPIDDNLGKELITRFSTNLNTNKLWFTDSNGMVCLFNYYIIIIIYFIIIYFIIIFIFL